MRARQPGGVVLSPVVRLNAAPRLNRAGSPGRREIMTSYLSSRGSRRAARALRLAALAVPAIGVASHAFAWQSAINGFGQGQVRGSVWGFPNTPPNPPNFFENIQFPGTLSLGPNLPGTNPLTQIFVSGAPQWQMHANFRAAGGDTVDWHSLLPLVSPSSVDASGSLSIMSTITGPNSATYVVTWSGSDAGVAQEITWFDGPIGSAVLHEEVRIGPWSETITIPIVSTVPIAEVTVGASGAAVTMPIPAPGAAGVALTGLVLAARRRRPA